MNEDSTAIPLPIVIAYTLWTLVVVTLLATWILMAVEQDRVAIIMGLTSGVIAPAAAACTVRCYFVRLSSLVRITSGLNGAQGPVIAELHTIH